jgi:co-chaperonin GroES (HSP10)
MSVQPINKSILVRADKPQTSTVLDISNEDLEVLPDSGVIISVGEKVLDKRLSPGTKIYFQGFSSLTIEYTDLLVISEDSVMAIERIDHA